MREVEVRIEVGRGDRIRWSDQGWPRLISPLPCPFNYGFVPGCPSPEGDDLDALVLGPRLPRGASGRWPAWGYARFVDGGVEDPKLLCGPVAPTPADIALVERFFAFYAVMKRTMAPWKGAAFEGVVLGDVGPLLPRRDPS